MQAKWKKAAMYSAVLFSALVLSGCGTQSIETYPARQAFPKFAGTIVRGTNQEIGKLNVHSVIPVPLAKEYAITDLWKGAIRDQKFMLVSWNDYGIQGFTAFIGSKRVTSKVGPVTFFRFTGDNACYYTQAGNFTGFVNLYTGFISNGNLALKVCGSPLEMWMEKNKQPYPPSS